MVLAKIFWTLSGLVRRILLIRSIRHYDSVYIFMNVFPFGPPILEKIYLKLAKNVIYDIEDDLLSTHPVRVSGIASILKSKSKTKYLIRNSNHVIASSPELANKCNAISQKNHAMYVLCPCPESLWPVSMQWLGFYRASKCRKYALHQ